MQSKKTLLSILGWYGAGAILLAYALVSFKTLEPVSIVYQLLNLSGAIGIFTEAFSKQDWPAGVLNLIWAVIAIFALVRFFG